MKFLRGLFVTALVIGAPCLCCASDHPFLAGDTLHKQLGDFMSALGGKKMDMPLKEKMISMSAAGYVTGVADAHDNDLFCLPRTITRGVIVAVVFKFLEDHPNQLLVPAAQDVDAALAIAYPCNKPR